MSGSFGEELGGSPVDSGGSDSDSGSDSEDIGGDDLQAGTDPSAGTGGSDDDDLDIGGGADGDLQSGTDPSAGTGGPPEDDGFDPDPPSTNTGGFGGGGGGLLDDEIDSSVGNADDSGSSSSSPGEFPSPEEVNETVQESDTAQQDTDLTDTSSGSAQDNFSEETEEATPTGAEAPEQDEPTLQNAAGVDNFGQFVGRDISNARDVFISEQTERIASQNENVQASEIDSITLEETENGYQAVATVEQAPVFTNTTGTGFGGGRGRPGGPPVDTRTIATDQVSSIDLGGDSQGADGAGVPDAPADDSQTAPGGSFPDAPETVGGGFAPPEEAAAAEGSPLAGTDESVGEAVDTAVETVEDSPVADAGSAIATGSRNVAGFANRNVVSPLAGFAGERVDVAQQLLGTGARFDADTGEVETQTGPDIGNPFDLQAETETGQATAGIVEAGGRAATRATLGAPAGVVSTVNTGGQAAEFTGEAVADEGLQQGVTESAEAGVDTAQTAADAAVTAATERPLRTGAAVIGGVAGGLVGGTAAFRGAAGATSRARSARVRSQSDEIVDFEDISDRGVVGQTSGSDNPEFSPGAVEDTDVAVAEFQDQASDAPDALQEMAGGEEVVFNVNEQGGLPDTGTVQAGPRSEVSGLFTAADASDLRLRDGGDSGGGLFGVPSLSDFRDQRRIAATNPEDIRGVPDELGGSRTPGEDLDRPTRDDSGEITGRDQGDVSDFITQEGTEGEAFVLPRGTRTSEQEAVIPEGTSFRRTGDSVAVNFEGDTIPLNVFEFGDARRGDVDADTPPRVGGFDGETTSRVTRRGDPGASGRTVGTVTPSGGAGSGSAGAGGGGSTAEPTTPGGDSPPIFDTPSGGSPAGGPDNGDSGGPFGGDGDSPGGGGSGGGGPGGSPPFITDGSSTTGGSTPPDEPTGGGFSFGFGIPSRPGQPPRRPRLDSDTEPDEEESDTAVFATSDTFASGILSADDVLDS